MKSKEKGGVDMGEGVIWDNFMIWWGWDVDDGGMVRGWFVGEGWKVGDK